MEFYQVWIEPATWSPSVILFENSEQNFEIDCKSKVYEIQRSYKTFILP